MAGLLRLDKSRIAAEAKTDGRTLLRTSHLTMDTANVARGNRARSNVRALGLPTQKRLNSAHSGPGGCGRTPTGVSPAPNCRIRAVTPAYRPESDSAVYDQLFNAGPRRPSQG